MSQGKIVQVMGPVVDVEFEGGDLPEVLTSHKTTNPSINEEADNLIVEAFTVRESRRRGDGKQRQKQRILLGVLPADRRCFRLFVHLGNARGWSTQDLAAALALTARRVRQLKASPEPMLRVALMSLADPRLCVVP